MKRYLLLGVLALAALVSCSRGDSDPRLVIITYDGLRWQEVYTGADEALLSNPRHVRDVAAAKEKYWRDTPQARRETLLPFIWSYVPAHGYMVGNRELDSRMQVDNGMSFSYPGYSEMFCGWADDARIDNNDPIPNPNVSVLEVVNRDPRYKGRVMMYASWESIRFALNNERGGFPGSAGHEPPYTKTPMAELAQQIDEQDPTGFGESERSDAVTCIFALEALRKDHPKVFYVGFGDTDEYGHDSAGYDRYLDAAQWTDGYIRRIVEQCEADPFYKGKTTYLLLCDHGRGRGEKFTSHGASSRGSGETWFMAFGKGVPVLGETSGNGVFFNKQLAATIADILGVDFTPDNGVKCDPIDPAFQKEPEGASPEASAVFEAVQATPKGQGLRFTYSEGNFMSVGEVAAAPVKARGFTPVFGTEAVKQREDHFGLIFKGLMKIAEAGVYHMSLVSDDGSKLWLDGQLLWDIDRDGGGARDAWIRLGEGYHRLEVQYFENYGGEDLEVGLDGPGISVDNLPAEMLYYE